MAVSIILSYRHCKAFLYIYVSIIIVYDVIHHQSANNMRFPFLKNNMTVPSYINGFFLYFCHLIDVFIIPTV